MVATGAGCSEEEGRAGRMSQRRRGVREGKGKSETKKGECASWRKGVTRIM